MNDEKLAGPPGVPSRKSPQPARIYTHIQCIMHALVHFGECANPFCRMRLSIFSNAAVYFGECLILFVYFTLFLCLYFISYNTTESGQIAHKHRQHMSCFFRQGCHRRTNVKNIKSFVTKLSPLGPMALLALLPFGPYGPLDPMALWTLGGGGGLHAPEDV